ncbi:hypothetical protein GCM10022219_22350 [Microbacterium oryzae]|uniref:Glycosyltransferase family 1 protein n=1 Tax=Microbacterium oryzae TaxID=743009 RepID=A0A6I6E7B1_9MICO|nr:hypothetical protein [Microbacterium oryzae]QGU27541.1 hypothetical protein D7D94_07585 [Microbacterium oryzae]
MTTYVYYPRGLATGGPEALHQLVDSLRRQGQEAFLVPVPGTESTPRAERYAHYDAPEAPAVVDAAGNSVVVPETQALLLRPLEHAAPFVWWLSIDYAPRFVIERAQRSTLPLEQTRMSRPPLLWLRHLKRMWRGWRTGEDAVLQRAGHLVQSHYAWNHIFAHLGRVGTILSDYTPVGVGSDGAGAAASAVSVEGRVPRITYNPAKSAAIMREFSRRYPELELLPLRGMTGEEVAEALRTSLIYLDLGTHPGKDRMPREAAAMGSVVLVARRGAAANDVDVPLPFAHKVAVLPDVVEAAHDAVLGVMADPDAALAAQAPYRERVLNEREVFDAEVAAAFIRGEFGRDGAAEI